MFLTQQLSEHQNLNVQNVEKVMDFHKMELNVCLALQHVTQVTVILQNKTLVTNPQ